MPRTLKANIWKMYISSFFGGLHFLIAVLVPFFMDWGKVSFFQMMLLQALFLLFIVFLEVPTGVVADYWGRKASLLLGGGANIITCIIYTLKPSFILFCAGEFLWALSASLVSGASQALIYDSLKKLGQENRSKKIFARQSSLFLLGLLVAAPIGGIIAKFLGLRWAMLLMVVPFSISFLICLTLKEPETANQKDRESYFSIMFNGIRYFISHKIVWWLAIDGVIITVFSFPIIWLYQPCLKEIGMDIVFYGPIASIALLTQIIVLNNLCRLEKVVKSKSRYLTISALLVGIAYISVYAYPCVTTIVIAISLIEGFGFSRFVLVLNYIQKHVESHNRATVISIASMLASFGKMCLFLLIGMGGIKNINLAFLCMGAIVALWTLIPKTDEEHLIE